MSRLSLMLIVALCSCSAAGATPDEVERPRVSQTGGGGSSPSAPQPMPSGGTLSLESPTVSGGNAAVVDEEVAADCGKLPIIVRDFPPYPQSKDFENAAYPPANPADAFTVVPGMVEAALGSDGKPVYANDGRLGGRQSLTDGASFGEWYRDVAGVNQRFDLELLLRKQSDGTWLYDSLVDGQDGGFFPINGRGFGDYASTGRNFHFTTLARLEFRYEGGELFTFSGDDDLWLFIAGALAIDLGGIHARVEHTVVLDDFAAAHGLSQGTIYPLDVFHAERHIGESNFKVRTSIACIRARTEPK